MVLEYGAFVAAAVSKYCASCKLFYPCVWNVHIQRVPAHHDKSIYWSGYFLGRIAVDRRRYIYINIGACVQRKYPLHVIVSSGVI